MERAAIDLLKDLVRIPSVTGEEDRVARVIAEWCGEAGLDVELQEVEPGRHNVLARWSVGRPPGTLLTGHLDTVPPGAGWSVDPFAATVAGRRLIGRGACDMKAGLAAMLAALLSLRRAGREPVRDVVFAGVVGEEEDSAGTRALLEQRLDVARAVVAEPTDLGLVCANRGLLNYRLTVKGRAAHASAADVGLNAVVGAADLTLGLDRINSELAGAAHPLFGPPRLTVGTIHGGTRPYVVPDRCVIEVDRRVNPGEDRTRIEQRIRAAVEEARASHPGLEVEVAEGPDYPPFEVPRSHPLAVDFQRAMSANGVSTATPLWPGASDAGLLSRAGVACVLFGPGSVTAAAHKPDEWVDLDQVEVAQRVFTQILLNPQP